VIRRPPLTFADDAKGETEMHLIHEDLARARWQARRDDIDATGLAARVAAARRWTRRAEHADRRARAARDAL